MEMEDEIEDGKKVTCDATAEAALAQSLARSTLIRFVKTANCNMLYLFSSMSVLQQYMYDAAGEICLETWRATNSRKSLSPRLPVLIASWPAGTDAGRETVSDKRRDGWMWLQSLSLIYRSIYDIITLSILRSLPQCNGT